MSDLERFRDHAAAMATAVHKPTCHRPSTWGWAREIHPDPACPGCVTDADRALWARLATEIDAYLTTDDTALWEDA